VITRKKKKQSLIFSAVMIALCVLLCLLPDTRHNEYSAIDRDTVRVDAVDNTDLEPLGIVYTGVQKCTVTVLSGAHAGESAQAYNYMNAALDKDALYVEGDTAYALVQPGDGILSITLIDHYRMGTELWIFAALAIALIGFGGIVGSGTLISLAASGVVIWKLLIPLLLDGINPILASLATVLVLTLLIDLLVAGFTRRCAVALLGSLAGTLVTFFLAMLFTDLSSLTAATCPMWCRFFPNLPCGWIRVRCTLA
jgi:uncharacterized membrane protein